MAATSKDTDSISSVSHGGGLTQSSSLKKRKAKSLLGGLSSMLGGGRRGNDGGEEGKDVKVRPAAELIQLLHNFQNI